MLEFPKVGERAHRSWITRRPLFLPQRSRMGLASLGTQKGPSVAVVVVADSIPGCQNVASSVANAPLQLLRDLQLEERLLELN